MTKPFNPNLAPFDPTSEKAPYDPTVAPNSEESDDFQTVVANHEEAKVDPVASEKEEPEKALSSKLNKGQSSSSLDKLTDGVFHDEDMRILALKYLLGNFDDLLTVIQKSHREVALMTKTLPELIGVIDNYVDIKKNDVSGELTELETKVATLSAILMKTTSESSALVSVELNKALNESVTSFKTSINEELKSLESTTKSIKSYMNKSSFFVVVFIFFLQILILVGYEIFIR